MARLAGKLALGLVLLSACALSASAQVAVADPEDLQPRIGNFGQVLPATERNTPLTTPRMSVRAWVSNTTNYFDADNTPGPWLTNRTNTRNGLVKFQIKVFNTGSVTLRNIKLVLRNLLNQRVKEWTITELPAGKSTTLYNSRPFALGQQGINAVATVTYNGQTITRSNRAYYRGVRPRISLSKSVQSGAQWVPANSIAEAVNVTQDPVFLFQIKNTGDLNLTNIILRDAQLGQWNASSLRVGQTRTFNVTGKFVAGLSNNTAQVRGSFRTETVFASDVAWTNGVQGAPAGNASLALKKQVLDPETGEYQDADNATSAVTIGSDVDPTYKFILTNTGDVELTNVTVVDPDLSDLDLYTIASLAVGETNDDTIVSGTAVGEADKTVTNVAYATANFGTKVVTSNNDTAVFKTVAPVDPVGPEDPNEIDNPDNL